ncbi:excisionase family DNA-binding protein [Pseudonocardia sp.]|uniref:excisionase family DNA-binding protein n=1 Tax=Pseudonocardia sp. TaxID=60912 RepID=UPI002637AF5F|nr:excisionase family DNA-binding protein [Pseudonocardia sp.]MCW2720490.1 hypothetical protein [Pseudonocardia sp.]
MLSGWLNTLQAAERLDVKRARVLHLIRTGRLDAVRSGASHYRLRVDVVDAYKAERDDR